MGQPKTKSTTKTHRRKDRAKEIANTCEWLITAFILAFVFRAFVMEAFRIPTGSMADTLKGAHWRLRCPQCGYRYDRGFAPSSVNLPPDTVPSQDVNLQTVKCPSCGFYQGMERHAIAQGNERLARHVDNGDRILVLKCLYQFSDPKRWDIIVFKNPSNPAENYIKRLVALPDEKIEIIDGDIYINDRIARKPRKVQNELWMPIYDNDYQPIHPRSRRFNRNAWENPLSVKGSLWRIRPEDPTKLHLDTSGDRIHRVHYQSPSANDFRATYSYNAPNTRNRGPICSDIMVRFYAETRSAQGRIGAVLSKYGVEYQGWVDLEGKMTLARKTAAGREVLKSRAISAVPQNR
ncbi:MAG: signal peptidase I, partial [Planctomycetes bacterium]|nr:signal peptidase I [Planctomycetota bacterium]